MQKAVRAAHPDVRCFQLIVEASYLNGLGGRGAKSACWEFPRKAVDPRFSARGIDALYAADKERTHTLG